MTRRYIVGMVLYVVATFALAFVDVVLSLALVGSLALLFALLPRARVDPESLKLSP